MTEQTPDQKEDPAAEEVAGEMLDLVRAHPDYRHATMVSETMVGVELANRGCFLVVVASYHGPLGVEEIDSPRREREERQELVRRIAQLWGSGARVYGEDGERWLGMALDGDKDARNELAEALAAREKR